MVGAATRTARHHSHHARRNVILLPVKAMVRRCLARSPCDLWVFHTVLHQMLKTSINRVRLPTIMFFIYNNMNICYLLKHYWVYSADFLHPAVRRLAPWWPAQWQAQRVHCRVILQAQSVAASHHLAVLDPVDPCAVPVAINKKYV